VDGNVLPSEVLQSSLSGMLLALFLLLGLKGNR
jgi:hypothetical protein